MPKVPASPEVKEYLESKGWWPPPYKSEEPDHAYLDCPFCTGKRFTIQVEIGLWDCKVCGEKGNLLGLKRKLGDLYVLRSADRTGAGGLKSSGGTRRLPPADKVQSMCDRLWEDEDAKPVRDYLTRVRCLPEKVLKDYGVGCVRRHNKWWVSWVAYNEKKQPVHVKFRTIPPAEREFRRWKGCDTVLYMPPDGLDTSKPLVICEGEPDLLSMVAYGYANVITGTAGATQGWPDSWVRLAQEHETVYVALDAGDAGERGSKKLAQAIGMSKCLRARPPKGTGDWNEALSAGIEKEEIDKCFAAAEQYKPDEIRTIGDYREDIQALRNDPQRSKGTSTGWESLDALWGGVRPAELSVVTGDTATGKTTWCSAMAWNMARKEGWPVLFAPFENTPLSIVRKLASMEANSDVVDTVNTDDKTFSDAMARLEGLPISLLEHWGRVEIDRVCDTIRWAAECEGVKMVVMDHLHYMVGPSDTERQKLDEAMNKLNRVALETNVHVMLVVHPRNIQEDDGHVQLNHLKGSSGIKQEAHNVFSVWRKRSKDRRMEESSGRQAVVTLLKCRDESGEEGRVVFNFQRGACRYEEAPQTWDIAKEKEDDSDSDVEDQGWTTWLN